MQVITDDLLTHYERAGMPKVSNTVLILPGWADTSKSWLTLQKALSAHYDVIVLDIPGFGGSQAPPAAWGLLEYVDFIEHFLRKIEVMELAAVIGHSNGGAMAIRAIGSGKIKPHKLVLLASAGIRGGEQGRKLGLKVLAKSGKVLTRPLPHSVREKLRGRLYGAAGSDLLVAEHMQDTFKRIVADDVQADAARVSVPTLLIYGSADTATPDAFGRTFAGLIKKSRLEILPGAGHFLHIDKTAELVQKIQEFLA